MKDSNFDNICDRFDASWQVGNPLAIEDLLVELNASGQSELLQALLEIELEYRLKANVELDEEEYRVRFPLQQKTIAAAFAATRKRLQFSNSGGIAENNAISSSDEGLSAERNHSSVGPYKILKPIGQGGMGQVFLAEQTEPIHRQVALKIIKSETPTREILARFDAERQALAMMDHHNIAKVFDAGITEDGQPYFAMELVEGLPITDYCDENKLSPDERLKLFAQTCRAIQHAHNKGIVHRDIKPSNVLVTLHDGKPTAKVIDFGLAKAVQGSNQLTDRTLSTQFGQVVGTLAYMSPEQAEMNSQDVDTRTDVYSLGVVFYELLTGSPPITREKLKSEAFDRILAIIREVEAPRPSSRLSELGDAITGISEQRRTSPKSLSLILKGDLDWIAIKALEKDRARRYDTPAALAEDIQRYLNNEAIEARPPSFAYQLQKSFRKHRARYFVAGTILGLLITGLAVTAAMWYRAASAENRAKQETRNAIRARENAEEQRDRADDERDRADLEAVKAVNAATKADKEAKRARDTAAAATFQLANARWDAGRVEEAQRLLQEIAVPYRQNFEWNLSYRQFQGSDETWYGHSKRVTSVSFSPDGSQVVSGSDDASIRMWNASTGETVEILTGHTAPVTCVLFSLDGSRIASASEDGTIKIWDGETGSLQMTFSPHDDAVTNIAFSPDGSRIASASEDATVKIWISDTGELQSTFRGHQSEVTSIAFSPDGKRVASGGRDKTVRVWDAQSNKELKVLAGHSGVVTCVSFCPKGAKLASASSDQSIRMWDTDDWQLVRSLKGKEFTIESIQFSPDGATIASVAVDNIITVWDVEKGEEIRNYMGHTGVVTSVAFSPDGSRIVSGSGDKTVKLWDLTSEGGSNSLKGHLGIVSSLSFSKDGSTLATVGMDQAVRLWDADTSKLTKTLRRTDIEGSLNGVCLSSDGSKVVFGSTDRFIRLWDTTTGQLSSFAGHEGVINSVAFSPDGSTFVSASNDQTIRLWDANTGLMKIKLTGTDRQTSVAFSPDGSKVVSGNWNGLIQFWNTESGEKIGSPIRVGYSRIWSISFTKDGKKMALGCADAKIKLCDATKPGEFRIFKGHTSSVTGVSFNPDGSRIVSSSYDGKLKLWETSSGKELKSFGSGEEPLLGVSFSPDGSRIASAGYDGKIDLWEGDDRHEVKMLIGHSRIVSIATFSPDGSRVYSQAGKEKLVWSTESGGVIPDGKWLNVPHRQIHGRWLLVRSRDLILLVDTEYKNTPRERAYRAYKTAPRPSWHRERYAKAINQKDWYAACFHSAWLLRLDPGSKTAYDKLHHSYERLEPGVSDLVPSIVKESLGRPKPKD